MQGLADLQKFNDQQTRQSAPMQGQAVAGGIGTALGSALGGPLGGALIGAGASTLGGILSQRAAKKQQQRNIQAQSLQNIGRIEQETGAQKNLAFSNLMGALRSAFLG